MTMDKAKLFASRLKQEDVELEGLGTFRYRALSRAEVLSMRGKEVQFADMERDLLSAALVDPALTPDEVRQWQEASPAGELEPLTNAIMRLSGLAAESAKDVVKRF